MLHNYTFQLTVQRSNNCSCMGACKLLTMQHFYGFLLNTFSPAFLLCFYLFFCFHSLFFFCLHFLLFLFLLPFPFLFLSVCISFSFFIWLHLYFFLYLFAFPSLSLSPCISFSSFICLHFHLFLHLFAFLSLSLPVCISFSFFPERTFHTKKLCQLISYSPLAVIKYSLILPSSHVYSHSPVSRVVYLSLIYVLFMATD